MLITNSDNKQVNDDVMASVEVSVKVRQIINRRRLEMFVNYVAI